MLEGVFGSIIVQVVLWDPHGNPRSGSACRALMKHRDAGWAGREPAQQGALWDLASGGLTARCKLERIWKRQSLIRLKWCQVGEVGCGHQEMFGCVGEEGGSCSAPGKLLQQWIWAEEPKRRRSGMKLCVIAALALGGESGGRGGCL